MLAHEVGSAASVLGDIGLTFQLNLLPPHGSDDRSSNGRSRSPRAADVAVVVVGSPSEAESEGLDRTSLALSGRQDELVRRIAAANPTRLPSSTPGRRC